MKIQQLFESRQYEQIFSHKHNIHVKSVEITIYPEEIKKIKKEEQLSKYIYDSYINRKDDMAVNRQLIKDFPKSFGVLEKYMNQGWYMPILHTIKTFMNHSDDEQNIHQTAINTLSNTGLYFAYFRYYNGELSFYKNLGKDIGVRIVNDKVKLNFMLFSNTIEKDYHDYPIGKCNGNMMYLSDVVRYDEIFNKNEIKGIMEKLPKEFSEQPENGYFSSIQLMQFLKKNKFNESAQALKEYSKKGFIPSFKELKTCLSYSDSNKELNAKMTIVRDHLLNRKVLVSSTMIDDNLHDDLDTVKIKCIEYYKGEMHEVDDMLNDMYHNHYFIFVKE